MYAVIELGGKQYKVAQGDKVLVDRLDLDEGKSLSLTPLLVGGEAKAVTAAELKGAKVKAKVEEHLLGDKIRVFKYKPKSGYRRTKGHRSRLSRVSIETITGAGMKDEKKTAPKAETKASKDEAKADTAEAKAPKAEAKTEATTTKAENKAAKETKSAKADTKPAKETKTAKKDTKPEKE